MLRALPRAQAVQLIAGRAVRRLFVAGSDHPGAAGVVRTLLLELGLDTREVDLMALAAGEGWALVLLRGHSVCDAAMATLAARGAETRSFGRFTAYRVAASGELWALSRADDLVVGSGVALERYLGSRPEESFAVLPGMGQLLDELRLPADYVAFMGPDTHPQSPRSVLAHDVQRQLCRVTMTWKFESAAELKQARGFVDSVATELRSASVRVQGKSLVVSGCGRLEGLLRGH